MRICILSSIRSGAWGGGNQFLRALGHTWQEHGILRSDPADANVLLANSYQDVPRCLLALWHWPHTIVVWRLGPIFSLHRGASWQRLDRLLVRIAMTIARMVIFQSDWSRDHAIRLGFSPETPHRIIRNAVDRDIFYPFVGPKNISSRIKIIIVSWSDNWNKGFPLYQYLDTHLDFSKYEVTFVGSSPVQFQNIRHIGKRKTEEIAELMRHHDLCLSAVKDDACSNAILEALASGLPVVALASGANKELVGSGGRLFNGMDDLLPAIHDVASNKEKYQRQISVEDIEVVARRYEEAAKTAVEGPAKPLRRFTLLCFLGLFYWAWIHAEVGTRLHRRFAK